MFACCGRRSGSISSGDDVSSPQRIDPPAADKSADIREPHVPPRTDMVVF